MSEQREALRQVLITYTSVEPYHVEDVLDRLEACVTPDHDRIEELAIERDGARQARRAAEARLAAVEALCDSVDAQEWFGPSHVVEVRDVRAALRGGS